MENKSDIYSKLSNIFIILRLNLTKIDKHYISKRECEKFSFAKNAIILNSAGHKFLAGYGFLTKHLQVIHYQSLDYPIHYIIKILFISIFITDYRYISIVRIQIDFSRYSVFTSNPKGDNEVCCYEKNWKPVH